ncbi:MAG TPA: hypothetical protein DCQ39_05680 [Lachnospiraceae bacterium]|nr:hypothetical protein [Lachnospiraceae bacterium]
MKKNKELLWTILTFLIALLTISAVVGQSKELTFSAIGKLILDAKPGWIFLAALSMISYILMEGIALWILLRASGFRKTMRQSTTYAAADIYCSAITPSATGGQPVAAWFMRRDGIPTGYITAILMMYLVLHTFSTLTIAVLTPVIWPSVFAGFSILAKLLILLGAITITGLAVLFVMLLRMEKKIYRVGCRIIDWLTRKKIVKRDKYWKEKLADTLADYSKCVKEMFCREKIRPMLQVYGLNIAQRLCQTIIAPLVYAATGGVLRNMGRVFATQVFATIGSICVPIPGGMGVADYLLYNGLRVITDHEAALQLELLSRSFSFYATVLISMIIVLAGYISRRTYYFVQHLRKK